MAGGRADILYVLCLMQAAFVLLGGLGEMLLMGGSPLFLALPLAKMVLLFVVGAKVVSGRRWAVLVLFGLQLVTASAVVLQLVVGLLAPFVDFTLNLVGLITNLVLPIAAAWLCVGLLRAGFAPAVVPPQDPYAPAPLVTSTMPLGSSLPAEVAR